LQASSLGGIGGLSTVGFAAGFVVDFVTTTGCTVERILGLAALRFLGRDV
jgi:hypothetical protein